MGKKFIGSGGKGCIPHPQPKDNHCHKNVPKKCHDDKIHHDKPCHPEHPAHPPKPCHPAHPPKPCHPEHPAHPQKPCHPEHPVHPPKPCHPAHPPKPCHEVKPPVCPPEPPKCEEIKFCVDEKPACPPEPPKCEQPPVVCPPEPPKCEEIKFCVDEKPACPPEPPKCEQPPVVCPPEPPKCEQPPVCEPKPPECEPKPPECEPKPPECEPKPPECEPKPPCNDDCVPLPVNLSNIVFYLDNPDTAACDIIKVKFDGGYEDQFINTCKIQDWIDSHGDILGGHTDLIAFSVKAGNNFEGGENKLILGPGEGQLVFAEDGINSQLANDVILTKTNGTVHDEGGKLNGSCLDVNTLAGLDILAAHADITNPM